MVIKMTFMLVPFGGVAYSFFYFSDVQLTIHTYVYFLCEHIGYILLSYIIYSESDKYEVPLFTFFCLMVADTFDYMLSYNSTWVTIGSFPITMNTAIVVIFGMAILYEEYLNDL